MAAPLPGLLVHMRQLPRPQQCAAIVESHGRYKIEGFIRCQGGVLAKIGGVGLCGTHINAIEDGPLLTLRELEKGLNE